MAISNSTYDTVLQDARKLTKVEQARLIGALAQDLVTVQTSDQALPAERLNDSERAARVERALAAVGRFRSGLSDLGTNHDAYLDEAYMGKE